MLVKGVPAWAAWTMWAGERAGGWWPWLKRWLHRRWYGTRSWPILGATRRYTVSAQELYYLRVRAREHFLAVDRMIVN